MPRKTKADDVPPAKTPPANARARNDSTAKASAVAVAPHGQADAGEFVRVAPHRQGARAIRVRARPILRR